MSRPPDAAVLLRIDVPGGAADVRADGTAPLRLLLPALAAAAGVADPHGWWCWDGERRLDLCSDLPTAGPEATLAGLGVLSGSVLRLVPPPGGRMDRRE